MSTFRPLNHLFWFTWLNSPNNFPVQQPSASTQFSTHQKLWFSFLHSFLKFRCDFGGLFSHEVWLCTWLGSLLLCPALTTSVARYRERNKQAGLWKQAQNKRLLRSWLKKKKKKKERDYYTLHTHKYQYDMQYNRKRNTLTTSPKTRNPRLPIFIRDSTEKQVQSRW